MRRFSFAVAALTVTLLPAVAQTDVYAAIAFSPSTGKAGTAWNFATQGMAETEAYAQCGYDDCDTVVWFTQCGAIAVGDGFGYGYGYDLSIDTAVTVALQNCDGYTTNCEITAAFCNEGY